MKNIFIILGLSITFVCQSIDYSQYDSEVSILRQIDRDIDLYGSLNWDFETNPLCFKGVEWSLRYVDDEYLYKVVSIDISQSGVLGVLDVSRLMYLKELNCSRNGIDSLVFSEQQYYTIRSIDCSENFLRSFPLYDFRYLGYLDVSYNIIDVLSGTDVINYHSIWCVKMYVIAMGNFLDGLSFERARKLPNVVIEPQLSKPLSWNKYKPLDVSGVDVVDDMVRSCSTVKMIQVRDINGVVVGQTIDNELILRKKGVFLLSTTHPDGLTHTQKIFVR